MSITDDQAKAALAELLKLIRSGKLRDSPKLAFAAAMVLATYALQRFSQPDSVLPSDNTIFGLSVSQELIDEAEGFARVVAGPEDAALMSGPIADWVVRHAIIAAIQLVIDNFPELANLLNDLIDQVITNE